MHLTIESYGKLSAARGRLRTRSHTLLTEATRSRQKFQSALRHIGFDVKLKPLIRRADGSAKGDWDVGITIDVMDTAPSVKRVILLSGDGDFEVLVNKIRVEYDVYVEVYGVSTLTAKALIDSADAYHPIDYNLLV